MSRVAWCLGTDRTPSVLYGRVNLVPFVLYAIRIYHTLIQCALTLVFLLSAAGAASSPFLLRCRPAGSSAETDRPSRIDHVPDKLDDQWLSRLFRL